MPRGRVLDITEKAAASALTANPGTLTYTPGDPDNVAFALTEVVAHSVTTGYGFVDQNDAEGFIQAVVALQTRVTELETALYNLGALKATS